MGAYEMIVGSPPLEMSQQLWGLLSGGPGATSQRRYSMTDAQINPFNKSGVEPSREAHPLQGDREICLCPEAHHLRDPRQLTPPIAFFHLAVDQTRRHLPSMCFPPSLNHLKPLAEMGRESIKVHIQAITGEERQTARGQDLSQGVDECMRHVLRAGTQMEDGKKLRARVDSQPQPEHLCGAAQPCSQFVQLEVWELEMAE